MTKQMSRNEALERIEFGVRQNCPEANGSNIGDCDECWRYPCNDMKALLVLRDLTEKERPHGEWIPCSERLPETDKKVLVNLHNTYGRDVILMASHIGYHERTSEDYGWQEFEGNTEYDEENDCFWIPECWCESNYVEDNANWIIDECEGTITHWMPLPEPYKKEGEAET